jgi:mono/diheme cytochrome c family protein
MRQLGLWSVAASLALAAWAPGSAPGQALFSPTQDPLAGSRVFGEKGCGRCHASNGIGGTVGPDLGRIPQPRSFFDLAAAMWNHLPQMAERMRLLGVARPALDPREAGDLAAFLYTLSYFDPPGNPEAGRRLFTTKRCVVCHQVGGAGGVVGPSLDFLGQYASPILVASAMWNHGPAMAQMMRARRIERPVFRDSELVDLLAYLRSAAPGPAAEPLHVLPGRADEGRRLFVEKRCAQCHGAGKAGPAGPDLGPRGLHRSLTQFAAAMWNKAPAMMEAMKAQGIALPELRAGEMADLVAYLYSVRYFAEPGDARRGRALLEAKGCLACHGLEGKGGVTAGDLAQVKGLESPAAVVAGLWTHTLVAAGRPDAPRGAWPELRAGEIADLIAFLQAPRRAR